MAFDELQFAAWLREQQRPSASVAQGIGDDMAAVTVRDGLLLLSSDMLLDGVHFDTAHHGLPQIGRKAISCSLSDCAAMAVRPMAATVSVALPKQLSLADTQDLFRGMFAVAEEFEMAIVGGDTTRWRHPLAIDVAISAIPYPDIDPATRAGAKPGDTLFVTGPLGGSLREHHLGFTPRILEAKAIAQAWGGRLHAMIDISDGLSLDLWRLCEASLVGATLEEAQLAVVISDEAQKAAEADDRTALDHALDDGEDYELLLAASGDVSEVPVPLFPVGTITDNALRIRRTDGRIEPLEPRGYVH